MKVESSREKELFWHCWPNMPKGLQKDDAYTYFLTRVKPKDYRFEKFHYDPKTGRCATL